MVLHRAQAIFQAARATLSSECQAHLHQHDRMWCSRGREYPKHCRRILLAYTFLCGLDGAQANLTQLHPAVLYHDLALVLSWRKAPGTMRSRTSCTLC